MSLTYAEQAALSKDADWQDRVYACVADVAQSQIRTLVPTDNNYTQLLRISVDSVKNREQWIPAFSALVAAQLPATVVLATPVAATATDAQIRTQVRNAFNNLVVF